MDDGTRVPDGRLAIPSTTAELTADWFSAALDADVHDVEIVAAHSGTTGRAKVALKSGGAVPDTLFVKLQPFAPEQRELMRATNLGVTEAQLYAAVGDDLPVRVPRVWHSSFDTETGEFIVVLEDLDASGCRFASDDDDPLRVAEGLVTELAKLHAKYWGQELSWLGTHPMSPEPGPRFDAMLDAGADMVQCAIDAHADDFGPAFREFGELFIARYRDLYALYTDGEATLAHCDDHIGNVLIDGTTVGLYDWSCASRFPGIRDVAYFLCNSLPTEVRRAEETRLLARYRAGLAEQGIHLDEQVAHDQYRLFSTYSWISATTTLAAGSRMQPLEIGMRATERCTRALIDLEVFDLLRDRLGGAPPRAGRVRQE